MIKTIHVLLADDHPLIRAGIRSILAAESDLTLVGEATTGDEAQRLCQELQPEVLLLDLQMPGLPPSEIVSYLREHCPSVSVLILTAYDDNAYVHDLAGSGIVGYVLKDEAPEAVVQAIRTVVQGGTWFSRSVIEKLIRLETDEPVQEAEELSLTGREQQILSMMAQGWDNARLAVELNLAKQTVRNYVSRIYTKLGVSSRAEAIVWARKHGFE
jgi:DNA-binding NarL/FixJ family response regulator